MIGDWSVLGITVLGVKPGVGPSPYSLHRCCLLRHHRLDLRSWLSNLYCRSVKPKTSSWCKNHQQSSKLHLGTFKLPGSYKTHSSLWISLSAVSLILHSIFFLTHYMWMRKLEEVEGFKLKANLSIMRSGQSHNKIEYLQLWKLEKRQNRSTTWQMTRDIHFSSGDHLLQVMFSSTRYVGKTLFSVKYECRCVRLRCVAEKTVNNRNKRAFRYNYNRFLYVW